MCSLSARLQAAARFSQLRSRRKARSTDVTQDAVTDLSLTGDFSEVGHACVIVCSLSARLQAAARFSQLRSGRKARSTHVTQDAVTDLSLTGDFSEVGHACVIVCSLSARLQAATRFSQLRSRRKARSTHVTQDAVTDLSLTGDLSEVGHACVIVCSLSARLQAAARFSQLRSRRKARSTHVTQDAVTDLSLTGDLSEVGHACVIVCSLSARLQAAARFSQLRSRRKARSTHVTQDAVTDLSLTGDLSEVASAKPKLNNMILNKTNMEFIQRSF